MHTTMVPEHVKTMKIQAGIQVSRPGELKKQFQLWKRFGRLYSIVFVLVRNINNMPPKRTSVAATVAVVAAAPMTAAAVEQLIEARVSATLANHKTLRNSTNGHGDGSHISGTGTRGTIRTPRECTDVASYTLRFQELALMCERMFHEESEEVEKYVGGLPDMIQGNVMSYQPKKMEKAIEFANDQMDQKVHNISKRQAEQNRKI
ncbi:hypothetical protein Tco_1269052 [Tanacetum coccineum]